MTSNNQKYWFMTRGLHTEGWNPIINDYEKVQQDKIPPEAENLRNVSYEPDSQLSNLPLSIYQLLKFGENIGSTDTALTTMILQYLKKFKETVLDSLNTKKANLHSILQQLTYPCTTHDERIHVQKQLATFSYKMEEPFGAALTQFDSCYHFYLQFDCPIKAEEITSISLATLRSITPYLLSPKCANLYGDWLQDCTKMSTPITKDSIIKTVSKLETNPELQLTAPKSLPPFLATTLNLPHYMSEVTASVHLVESTNTSKSKSQSTGTNTNRNV